MTARRNRHEPDFNHDVWNFLPERFVTVYSELVRRGLATPGSSVGGSERVRGGSGGGGPLKDAQALAQKRRIDRVLRKLALEAETGKIIEQAKCENCALFVQQEWKWCAWCGKTLTGEPERGSRTTWTGVQLR